MSRLLPASQSNFVLKFDLSPFSFVLCSLNQKSIKCNHDSLLMLMCKVIESTYFGNKRDMLFRGFLKKKLEIVFCYMACSLQHYTAKYPLCYFKCQKVRNMPMI